MTREKIALRGKETDVAMQQEATAAFAALRPAALALNASGVRRRAVPAQYPPLCGDRYSGTAKTASAACSVPLLVLLADRIQHGARGLRPHCASALLCDPAADRKPARRSALRGALRAPCARRRCRSGGLRSGLRVAA